jgi:hypothetical protein
MPSGRRSAVVADSRAGDAIGSSRDRELQRYAYFVTKSIVNWQLYYEYRTIMHIKRVYS